MVFVRALGTAQIDAGELRITPSSIRKFALLLRLAAEEGRRVPRAVLRELIFPDLPERNARHSLRELAYQFRQAGVQLESDTDGITLIRTDVGSDYDALVRTTEPTVDQLRAAQGGLLPGYAPEHSEAFTDWLAAYRARTTLDLCRALSRIAARAKTVGNWLITEHAARACLELEPTHEEATFALAETLAVSGSKAQALALIDSYVRDVGPGRAHLQMPAAVVRRRISERVKDQYRTDLTLPFLGRESEMLLLRERFELARDGESQCVVIVGDAGIGKSRLAEEFCTQAVLAGARVEHVATQPHDTHRPLATFADLVPRLLQLPGALGCSPESMSALKRLTTHDSADGVEIANDAPSEAVAAAIARAIADLIDALTSETTLVLLVDDIQWSDELSRRTLVSLAAAKRSRRLVVMLTSRDRTMLQFFAQRAARVQGLSLSPLRHAPLLDILARLLNGEHATFDHELCEWIAQSSGGNPFFLRCLVSHYQTTGERFSVPASLSSLLDQQIASLGDPARALLEMCVALSRHAHIDRVVAALELSHATIQIAMRELEVAHLIIQQGGHIEPAHWLVAEAVTRSTTPITRQLAHRRVAGLLESEAIDFESPARLWDCAEHWIVAGEHSRAAHVMRKCATHSLTIGRPREAAETLLRAASLTSGPDQISLATEAVQVADSAGELDLLRRGTDFVRERGRSINYDGFELAEAYLRISELDYSPELQARLRRWLEPGKAPRHRMMAGLACMIIADLDGIPRLAAEVFQTLSSGLPDPGPTSDILTLKFLLIYHTGFGDPQDAWRIADQLLVLAGDLEHAAAAPLQRMAAVAFMRTGRTDDACKAFETAFRSANESGLLRLQLIIASMLGGVHHDIGNDTECDHWIRIADQIGSQIGDDHTLLVHVILRAEIDCTRGNIEGARAALDAIHACAPNPERRIKRWTRAIETCIEHLSGGVLDPDAATRELLCHHVPRGELGDLGDFEAAVAIDILQNAGRAGDALKTLRRYLTEYRRDRRPLNRSLGKCAEVLEPVSSPAAAPM